jgi:Zn-dependent M28 family amino/carboxypeptidase
MLINKWITKKEDIEIKMRVKSKYVPNSEIANIVATSDYEKSKIIVSAHYDSFFNTVGAHDNASGTIALLKLSESFSKENNEHLRFIFFDAEEWNKYGAYCYAGNLKKKGTLSQVNLVINIDSVGVGDYVYFLTSPSIESRVKAIVEKLDTGIAVNVVSRKEFPQFDTWPFMKNGIPVIQVGTGGTPAFPYFHHHKDDVTNINYSLMENVVKLLKAFIETLLEENIQNEGI